jgi:Rps23 Pro-64 3,4-dihydroxylase Tpa1-like proline 4-hydroxylase
MEIKDCIKIIDNTINNETLEVILKWVKDLNFEYAEILNEKKDKGFIEKETRNTLVKHLQFDSQSMTEIHWAHVFNKIFKECIGSYIEENKLPSQTISRLEGSQILKYEPGGHYTWHVDHGLYLNRKISCIFYLNDGYEGGKLQFAFPAKDESLEIEPKKNRMIVWPSNFMFPHRVTPVEKGIRYSAVCWAV